MNISQQVRKKDIIEENIKAFDKSSKLIYENEFVEEKTKNEKDFDEEITNSNLNNLNEESYFKDLIKMKFEA